MTSSFAPLFEPTELDIVLLQGSRYRLVINVECDWEPDIVGWEPRMQLRASQASAAPLVADLSAYLTVLGSPANQVIVDVDADAAELFAPSFRKGAYDIVIEPADAAHALRVLQGNWRLDTEVSQ
jgi:hypothetical protein